MPGTAHHSGGHNKIAPALHLARGTYRPARHGRPDPPPAPPLSDRVRRQALRGLPAAARKLAAELLEGYGPWDGASIVTLRQFVQSAARLEDPAITADERPRETRIYLKLLAALNFEK